MAVNWVLYALLAYAIWAVCNTLAKIIRDKHIKSSFSYTVMVGFVGLLSLLVIPFTDFSIPPLPYLLLAIFIGILYFIGVLPFLKALSMEEVSRVIPIWQMTPLFVLVLAMIFIGEKLTLNYYIAFILIFIGSIIMQTRTLKGVFRLSKAFYLMIFSSIVFAVVHTLVKYLYLSVPYAEGFVYARLGTFLAAVCALAIFGKQRRKFFRIMRTASVKSKSLVFVTEVLNIIAVGISFYAIKHGLVSIVAVLEGFQPVFVLIFATMLSIWFPRILKEEISRKTLIIKALAIILMIIGLYFIYL